MITPRLQELLDQSGVSYHSISHIADYRANRIARAIDVPADMFAKTVILRVDGQLCMAVLPASEYIDLDNLRQEFGTNAIELADEDDIRMAFPDCDIGAMPPFGALYGMEVYVSPELRSDEEIIFNAGRHGDAVQMRYQDYEQLARPSRLPM